MPALSHPPMLSKIHPFAKGLSNENLKLTHPPLSCPHALHPPVLPHGLSAQDLRLRRLHWETDGEIELPLVSRRSLGAAVSWQEGRMRWVPRSAAVFPRH
jgi:hypothetical protein